MNKEWEQNLDLVGVFLINYIDLVFWPVTTLEHAWRRRKEQVQFNPDDDLPYMKRPVTHQGSEGTQADREREADSLKCR